MPKPKKITAYVDPEVHKAMRMEALSRGVTIGKLIEAAFLRLVEPATADQLKVS